MTEIKRSSPGVIPKQLTPSLPLLPRRNATLVSGSGIELQEVEEAIRELEERLGVQRRRKTGSTEMATSAELQSPGVRQERAPERPDGASVVRPTRPAMASVPANTQPKLARYSGAAQWEPYLAQLQLAARHCGWSEGVTASHLALALEGPALQMLLDLDAADQGNLKALTMALARRFS
ncbi:hypothetical protein AAFF_G00073650 [Aldrovandia affinis]|uniref:Uncharacterized protein n=1 Tax=Aldrovandia affinis TaxID=143900 RepID=A0AAD7S126_9TELE|nr:hypothetical protein AAFF_G00073650 [Aldrovandia affinis]